ncbi:GIY-YIG nuclease family protein [Cellulomonas dongxiuzhuiae]|uniref:GIY-YIG nuclease family protein n=1 Tax=Cellulomonas dongxiuzhuiae TaxID=2819979 RepID=UPI001AAFA2DA|nr:hypothetical protein [Cellulomonas dongxiuzhuiae]MBO3088274.1 hypothetical protein [Cellulomonas dongxiuzhuiae]
MDAQGAQFARQVADAADAWLRDPRDTQVYARLVAAVEAWREHVRPALEGIEHAGRRDPVDDLAAYPAADTAAAVAAAISSPPRRLDRVMHDVVDQLRAQTVTRAAPLRTGEWGALLGVPTAPVHSLGRDQVPVDPGVYLWCRGDEVVYVGTAANLRTRIWGRHLGGGVSLANSSLRRNVCEVLFGIPPTATGNPARQKVTQEQAAAIRAWLRECDLSWQTLPTPRDASDLEQRLRDEFRPRLNRL